MEDKLSIEPLDDVRVRVVIEYGPPLRARQVWGFSWSFVLFKCGAMTRRIQAGFTSNLEFWLEPPVIPLDTHNITYAPI